MVESVWSQSNPELGKSRRYQKNYVVYVTGDEIQLKAKSMPNEVTYKAQFVTETISATHHRSRQETEVPRGSE